ncbi:hypothetical protein WJX72_004392 [[Myrmecia] bisecta]|uniref:Uncharacterized protein n=1 Tax=[Myrmecia] bisecta TaxID=41462 RepID=A0AAW1Q329_9CHLO
MALFPSPPRGQLHSHVSGLDDATAVIWRGGGRGKTTCGECKGRGRVNYIDRAMLPKGAWPQWCTACRGSGLWFCERCMGTGVKRNPIGFRLSADE